MSGTQELTGVSNTDAVHTRVEGPKGSSTRRVGPYELTLYAFSGIFAVVAFWFVGTIFWKAMPAFHQQGLGLITRSVWNVGEGTAKGTYGLLPLIVGTVETSLIAILIAVIIGTGTVISIVFLLPVRLRTFVSTIVELLAAVPSVVYGVWGVLVLSPWFLNTLGPWLATVPGGTAIFGQAIAGKSLLLASIVLGVMILPTYVAVSREVISAVPHELVEASLSLGATRWQTLWRTVLPTARIGMFGATSLALGRAFGETVAVSLLAGGALSTNYHPLAEGSSLAAYIANQFGEAQGSDQIPALFAAGLILMLLSLSMSLISTRLVARQRKAAMA